jgi:hypothetical protein
MASRDRSPPARTLAASVGLHDLDVDSEDDIADEAFTMDDVDDGEAEGDDEEFEVPNSTWMCLWHCCNVVTVSHGLQHLVLVAC